jgi:hypothetical protein
VYLVKRKLIVIILGVIKEVFGVRLNFWRVCKVGAQGKGHLIASLII